MKLLVAIVGPTAVGKSRLALSLANLFGGEIVNADSRQVYRYMDIGTAKPSPRARSLVRHHLLDIVDPDEEFNVATYQKMARASIEDVHRRGKMPFLVGGTGMYVWSILEGWNIPEVPPDTELRRQLEARAASEGTDTLYHELEETDPAAAAKIHPHNLRRIIRALEVYVRSGQRLSEIQTKYPPDFDTHIIGLTADRERLHKLIDERVDNMIENGLVDEVRGLVQRGYHPRLPSMNTVGYVQISAYLQGQASLPQAIQQIKHDTHRLAIHQYAWFRPSDPRIQWLQIDETGFEDKAVDIIEGLTHV